MLSGISAPVRALKEAKKYLGISDAAGASLLGTSPGLMLYPHQVIGID